MPSPATCLPAPLVSFFLHSSTNIPKALKRSHKPATSTVATSPSTSLYAQILKLLPDGVYQTRVKSALSPYIKATQAVYNSQSNTDGVTITWSLSPSIMSLYDRHHQLIQLSNRAAVTATSSSSPKHIPDVVLSHDAYLLPSLHVLQDPTFLRHHYTTLTQLLHRSAMAYAIQSRFLSFMQQQLSQISSFHYQLAPILPHLPLDTSNTASRQELQIIIALHVTISSDRSSADVQTAGIT